MEGKAEFAKGCRLARVLVVNPDVFDLWHEPRSSSCADHMSFVETVLLCLCYVVRIPGFTNEPETAKGRPGRNRVRGRIEVIPIEGAKELTKTRVIWINPKIFESIA